MEKSYLSRREFYSLSAGQKKLLIFMRKYWEKYGKVPLEDVAKVLKITGEELPSVIPGIRRKAVCNTVEGDGSVTLKPRKFYLRWEEQEDRLNLIEFVLKGLFQEDALVPIEESSELEDLLANHVVVFVDGKYARGVVRSEGQGGWNWLRIFCYDYGIVVEEVVHKLYELPEELSTIPPICFRASLFEPRSSPNFHPMAVKLFQEIVRSSGTDRMDCCVESLDFNKGKVRSVRVSIRVPLGPWKRKTDLKGHLEGIQKELTNENPYEQPVKGDVDVFKLLLTRYPNHCIDVKEYLITNPLKLRKVQVAAIVSPSEFYLQEIPNTSELGWYESMQSFYTDPALSQEFKITTSCLFENRCYVWRENASSPWERVRVLKYPLEGRRMGTAALWLLDGGGIVEGNKRDMMELDQQFSCPTLTFRAELVHITQPCGPEWPTDAIDFFKQACKSKVFDVVILKKKEISYDMATPLPPITFSYGVVMCEADKDCATVQADLVDSGHAIPSGPCCGLQSLSRKLTMRLDYLPVNCLHGLAEVEGSTADPRNGCSFKQNKGAPESGVRKAENFPRSISDRMDTVCISAVIGPGMFYIQFRRNQEELQTMMRRLEAIAMKLPLKDLPAAGDIVLARVFPPVGITQSYGCWTWARVVLTHVEGKRTKGIAIDYGSVHSVSVFDGIRELPDQLVSVPSFCHRAHLDFTSYDSQMTVPTVSWSPVVRTTWKRWISAVGKKQSHYCAWQVHPNGSSSSVIELQEFNQALNFDGTAMSWYASRPAKCPEYSAINKLKDHSLLKQFYYTIGINLELMKKPQLDGGSVLFFPIWKILSRQRFITPMSEL